MKYLLDTNTISDFFKKIPSVTQRLEKISPNQIYISSISVMEIEFGLQLNPARAAKINPIWKVMLHRCKVVNYTAECAEMTAHIRAHLKMSGQPVGPYDILIAGSALANNLVVVTSNMSEFERIPDLRIQNWRIAE